MQHKKAIGWIVGVGCLVMAAAQPALANNLRVTNVTIEARNMSTAWIHFDLAWDNSWRYTNINHDAAWVFFKAKTEFQSGWSNVVLEYSGVNPTGCSTGTGTAIELIVPDDKVGLFVRRAAEGNGPES